MKIKLTVLIILLLVINSVSKGQVYSKEMSMMSAGIGVPNELKRIFSSVGLEAKGSPVFQLGYEHGLTDELSGGVVVAYATASYISTEEIYTGVPFWYSSYTKEVTNKWKFIILGIKGDYHFAMEKVDAYGGAMIGYASITEDSDGVKSDVASGLVYFPHVGIKYPFTPQISAYAELGYGISILNFGMSVSIK